MAVLFLLSFFVFVATKCQGQTSGCSAGFLNIHEGCYLPGDVPVTWVEAKQFCLERLSYLTTIETCEENGALLDAITLEDGVLHRTGSFAYWTSGQDVLSEDDWVWMTTGEPITCPGIWRHGEPNNLGGDESCLELEYYNSTRIGGNDANCDGAPYYNSYALCEVKYQPNSQFIRKL